MRSGRADPDPTRSESPHGQRRERATGRRRSRRIASQNGYGDFRTRRGAAVHLFRDGDAWTERINPNYPNTPVWRVLDGTRIGDFAAGDGQIYTDAIANPDDYRYLTAPAPRQAEMQALWSNHDR